jgi:hypothetical protein
MGSKPGDSNAADWNTHFRFAQTTGLRSSAHSNQNTTTQKGDISNQLTMGTFLFSLDRRSFFVLTQPNFGRKIDRTSLFQVFIRHIFWAPL